MQKVWNSTRYFTFFPGNPEWGNKKVWILRACVDCFWSPCENKDFYLKPWKNRAIFYQKSLEIQSPLCGRAFFFCNSSIFEQSCRSHFWWRTLSKNFKSKSILPFKLIQLTYFELFYIIFIWTILNNVAFLNRSRDLYWSRSNLCLWTPKRKRWTSYMEMGIAVHQPLSMYQCCYGWNSKKSTATCFWTSLY